MFERHRRRERAERQAAHRAMADGSVDLDVPRQLIAEVLGTRPVGAAEVRGRSGRLQRYPTAPEYDIDYLRLEIVPRAAGALPVTVDDYGRGGVAVFVGDSPPIELTAPININQ